MSADETTRVLITGVGMVTPVGGDREESWRGLVAGKSAVRWLDVACDSERAFPRWIGAPALCSRLLAHRHEAGDAQTDPVITLAETAAAEALADAGLAYSWAHPERTACVLGTSKGGFSSLTRHWQAVHRPQHARQREQVSWRQGWPGSAAQFVTARFGLRGGAPCPVAACATGLVCVNQGAEWIRRGAFDVVLAGSSDAALHPAVLGAFGRMGVLARGSSDPAQACRPFDRTRDGFAVGAGAAVLVLERADHARARGAIPYAEWRAGEAAADPAGLTGLDPEPVSLTWLIERTLRAAHVAGDELDYVNLHGTATRANDVCETKALKRALGSAARQVSTSSLKGTIGHLLGAAGSVELAAAVLALRDDIVPPTANLREPDPECDLDYTPQAPRPRRIETILKLSLGFGGHLAATVLSRPLEGPIRAASQPSP